VYPQARCNARRLIWFRATSGAVARCGPSRDFTNPVRNIELHAAGGEPISIGLLSRNLSLEKIIAEHDATPGIDRDHLARTKPALFNYGPLVDLDGARFRSGNEETVAGDGVTQRA
jgi:hypothetical protein